MLNIRLQCITALFACCSSSLIAGDSTETLKLLPDDGFAADRFGNSTALDGNHAAVGSYKDDDNATNSGSVYVFNVLDGQQVRKFTADDGEFRDEFGNAVSIMGDYVLVGAMQNDENGTDSGSAYLFSLSTGNQLFKFTPDDAAAGDLFGFDVALSNEYAIIGSVFSSPVGDNSGALYFFDLQTGTQMDKVFPTDSHISQRFGGSVRVHGNRAVVGANGDNDLGVNAGAAYLIDLETRSIIGKIHAPDGAEADFFGRSVGIAGDRAVVGAFGDDDIGDGAGAAYLFDLTDSSLIAKLSAEFGSANDQFGHSVTISESAVLVGNEFEDTNGTNSGSAYIFSVIDGHPITRLVSSDNAAGHRFGSFVSIDNDRALLGALETNDNGNNSGAAYLFDLEPLLACIGDINNDDELDIFDVFAFIDLFNATSPDADINNDSIVDIFDVFAFIKEYNAGCP